MGRLCHQSKSNHLVTLLAVERAVSKGERVRLVFAGASQNPTTVAELRSFVARAAGTLAIEVVADPDDALKHALFAAADVFVSLSDNIQETFGLAVVKAMASRLPCVVSDWGGHRDLIRSGREGFLVPTVMAPPAMGTMLGALSRIGALGYHGYVGQVAARTAVDVEAAASALRRLLSSRQARMEMGERALRRAVECFDWTVVLAAHRELRDRLHSVRQTFRRAPVSSIPPFSPFETFSKHATRTIDHSDVVRLVASGEVDALRLEATSAAAPFADLRRLLAARLAEGPATVGELVGALDPKDRGRATATIIWMLKFGVAARVE